MGRVAVIGDIAGHIDELTLILTGLGVDTTAGIIPSDLHIVQVGDLIHRGPDSPGVINLIERIRQTSGEQWTQLIGNHEAQYVRTPAFRWHEVLPDASADILRDWWASGWMTVATSISTGGQEIRATGGSRVPVGHGDLLVTHAGLTAGRWGRLGSPASGKDTAAAVNDDARSWAPDDWVGVWSPGVMLTGKPDMAAGCVWAASDSELARSWVQYAARAPLPTFHQAHGHSRPAWRSRAGLQWSPAIREIDRAQLHRRFDEDTRISRLLVLPAGAMPVQDALGQAMALWGTDPGHTERALSPWNALELPTGAAGADHAGVSAGAQTAT
jgi:hypothetical protein